MSRPKVDPVERTFDAFNALTTDQMAQFEYMRKGQDRTLRSITTPPKPARVRKVKAPEVQGA